jgi:hypothetical protein
VQQAVGVKVMEVTGVPVHGLLERPIQNPDVLEWKRTDRNRDLGLDLIETSRFLTLAGGEGKH